MTSFFELDSPTKVLVTLDEDLKRYLIATCCNRNW